MVSLNPADGSVLAHVPACDAADIDRAAVAADGFTVREPVGVVAAILPQTRRRRSAR